MTKNNMIQSLAGLGIVLFFSCFILLRIIAESYLYLETGLCVFISLFMTVLGLLFQYFSLRIRKLEMQVECLLDRRTQETKD